MPSGNFVGRLFTAEDTFYGQLGGCLEMIDCGTTTVADFAHINLTAEHSKLQRYLTGSHELKLIRLQRHIRDSCIRDTLQLRILRQSAPELNDALRDRRQWARWACHANIRSPRKVFKMGKRKSDSRLRVRWIPILTQTVSGSTYGETRRIQDLSHSNTHFLETRQALHTKNA